MKPTKYFVRDRRLFASKEGQRIELGARIQVVRKIRRAQWSPSVELRFDELTGRDSTVEIGLGTAQSHSALLGALATGGYKVPEGRIERLEIARFVLGRLSQVPTVTLPATNGWFRDTSVSPSQWQFNLHQPVNSPPTAGTVASWKRNVAALIAGNPYLVFLASAAFAAPLVDLHSDASPILVVVGTSGSGKSTSTGVARSIYQPAEMRGSFDGTENGLAAFVRDFNHSIVELDELGSGDPSSVINTIYRISNGTGKLRANTNGRLLQLPPHRGILLASGEHSLFEAAHVAGKRYPEGFDARWIALPIDAKHPMFPNVHGEPSAAQFSERLTEATKKSYGVVGRKYIHWLIEQRNAGHDLGRKGYAKNCQLMRNASDIEERPRQFDRVAKHFALIATGGELASSAGFLHLKEGEATEAAMYALRAWAEAKAGFELEPDARMLRDVRQWLMALKAEGGIVKFTRAAYDDKEGALAFHHKRRSGGEYLLIRPEALQKKFGSQSSAHVRALKASGHLLTGPRDIPTKQIAVPTQPSRTPSFYAVHVKFFQ